ncbi:hypothetical protein [Neisseria wadsworthii]|uniref:hypothetical protein n=1 Tax=Neisseria wadsworthii TaxID=607711 RepID=UPI000D3212F3|nr:hypothetical protein [Neisseria wadsworthii]
MVKKIAAICGVVWLLGACGNVQREQITVQGAQPQILPPFGFMKDAQGAQQVGQGKVGYRFILLEPNTAVMAANKPFMLAHRGGNLPFANGSDGVYLGVTDAKGITPLFLFETQVPEDGFVLLERIGKGNSGAWLDLTDNGRPLIGVRYTLNVCDEQPYQYQGVTNTRGQTVYVAADKGTNVHISAYREDEAAQKAALAHYCPTKKTMSKQTVKNKKVNKQR